MITYSIIQKSQLEGALRLDAEYYQPEYLEAAKKLKKYEPLKKFVGNIIHPQEVKREYSESGYLFLLSQNLRENYLDFSDKFYINEETAKQISKNLLEENDIVTVRTGNIGLSAVISGFKEKIYASADVIVIKNPKISPFYISTFLNSKFGKMYLNRIIYGALQPHITPKLLGEIPLPLPDELDLKEIHKLVETALNNFKQSETFYSQAEDLLLKELGLKDFKVEDDLFYVVNLSKVNSAHRADAEYFQPKYEKILEKISKRHRLLPLIELFDFKRGIFISPEFYSEEKTRRPYIRIKELSGKVEIQESEVVFIDDKYPEDKKNEIREHDLVIAIIGDTIGKTNRITKELAGGFCSNNTGRLRIKKGDEILPEYAQVLFQSIAIQSQIEKKKAPTGQPKISDDEIKSLYIPILPKPTQQKIADLVQKSHEARKKAKQLLEEAKRKVEKLIEPIRYT